MFVGLDISTTVIGYAFLEDSPQIVIRECGVLKFKKGMSLDEKLKVFVDEVASQMSANDFIYIEDYLKFMPRKSNANTITLLAHFSGMIRGYFVCSDEHSFPNYISVATARKLAGMKRQRPKNYKTVKEYCHAELTKRFENDVPLWYTRTGNVKKETYDASDALVVAIAGHEQYVRSLSSLSVESNKAK